MERAILAEYERELRKAPSAPGAPAASAPGEG
jgi:hypothetical protein